MFIFAKGVVAVLAVTLLVGLVHGDMQTGMCVGTDLTQFNGNVMTGGDVKDMETWDAKPYSHFSTYASEVTGSQFRVWLSDKASAGGTVTFTAIVSKDYNNAGCDLTPGLSLDTTPPHQQPVSAFFANNQAGAKTLTVLPLSCTRGGQSLIIVMVKYSDTGKTNSFQYVHTHGVPVSVGTTVGGEDVISRGGRAAAKWDPNGFAGLNKTDAYTVSSTFYVTVPADRKNSVSYRFDYVPLGDADKRIDSTCKSEGDAGDACSHSLTGDYVDDNLHYLYPVGEKIPEGGGEGASQPFTIKYGCEVNGLVKLTLKLTFLGGYEPLEFSWVKECAFLPGLTIATSLNAALNVGDIARQGDVVPDWGFKNETYHVDPASGGGLSEARSFYFFLIQQGATVAHSTLTSIDMTSSRPGVCAGGKASLNVEQCTEFDGKNCGDWQAVEGNPSLTSNEAPIRLTTDYRTICPGSTNGETSFRVTVRFDQYLVVQFAWTKAVGSAPQLSLKCLAGCPEDRDIIDNGIVTSNWGPGSNIAFPSSIIASHFQFETVDQMVNYDIKLTSAVAAFDDKYACDLDFDHPIRNTVVPGSGKGTIDWTFYYWCRPVQSVNTVGAQVVLDLYPFTTAKYFFNKQIDFLTGFNVGTGIVSPYLDNVNSQGTPNQQGGWGKDVNVFSEMIQSLDQRDSVGKDFYVSFDETPDKIAFIPKPVDPTDPYLGFFKTNLTAGTSLSGCKPQVTVPSHPDFVSQGARLAGGGQMMHIQLRYNCDQSKSTCAQVPHRSNEGSNCFVKFTGMIPVRYTHKGDTTNGTDKSTVLFRWMKWLQPVPPFHMTHVLADGQQNKQIKLQWRVPLSGMGLDVDQNQLIQAYLINYTNSSRSASHKETEWQQLRLDVRAYPELKGKVGANVSYVIRDLTNGVPYRFKLTSINNFNLQCAEWSREIVYVPGAVLPTWAWVLIVAGVILLSAGGCFLYKVVKGQQTTAKGQVGGGTSYQSLDVAQPSISSAEEGKATVGSEARSTYNVMSTNDRFNSLLD